MGFIPHPLSQLAHHCGKGGTIFQFLSGYVGQVGDDIGQLFTDHRLDGGTEFIHNPHLLVHLNCTNLNDLIEIAVCFLGPTAIPL